MHFSYTSGYAVSLKYLHRRTTAEFGLKQAYCKSQDINSALDHWFGEMSK